MIFQKKLVEEVDFDFPNKIKINDNEFNISISLIKKNSSSVNIIGNTLNFRLSSKLSKKELKEHFDTLLQKIIKKLEKNNFKITNELEDFKLALEKGEFIFSEEKYYFKYHKYRYLKLEDKTFYINPKISDYEQIMKIIIKFLVRKYTERVWNYVQELNKETYNYKITGFHLNNVRSKWGHCSADNKIMLNLKLLNAPKEVMDYVIFHEISHIKYKNHSKDFWNEVSKHCPNHKNLRKYLKENPPKIFKL